MTAPSERDYDVIVCAECLCASCWHGEFMCSRARAADITTRKASELRALGREHEDYFSPEQIIRVCGYDPREEDA
jgi:hypothetical protein